MFRMTCLQVLMQGTGTEQSYGKKLFVAEFTESWLAFELSSALSLPGFDIGHF